MKRVGMYSGTFDPVHAGHLAFALEAIKVAELDEVCFLPERRPRHKEGVEHFGHRTAMIARAIKPHEKLSMLELPDIHFDTHKTLPRLFKEFPRSELIMLMGSDAALRLNADNWPASDLVKFLQSVGLMVAIRAQDDAAAVKAAMTRLPVAPYSLTIIEAPAEEISSSGIREAIRNDKPAAGLLPSVRRYARAQWLYASIDST